MMRKSVGSAQAGRGKGEGWVLRAPVGDPPVVQHGSAWFGFVSAEWLVG